jgi:hypothetical protein
LLPVVHAFPPYRSGHLLLVASPARLAVLSVAFADIHGMHIKLNSYDHAVAPSVFASC